MNILLLASHSVAEYDDIRMFTDMGHDVFCPGGYQDPRTPGEPLRPALPNAPLHPDLIEACERVRRQMGEPGYHIDWAKARLPDECIDWADVIIVHHFPRTWIGEQWNRIGHKRVIWRTCGQSNIELELFMRPFWQKGMQIVRYSPQERIAFEAASAFAGEDALIRFGKYPDDYGPWEGDLAVVGNVTQDMVGRADATSYGFWRSAVGDLPAAPVGKGSELLRGGLGELPYHGMLAYLNHLRVYLYTGTKPASYTLGLIEAAMSGVPIVSIPPRIWGAGWGGADLFEGHRFAYVWANPGDRLNVQAILETTNLELGHFLKDEAMARHASNLQREHAVRHFGIDRIADRWQRFLDGDPLPEEPEVSWFPEAVLA